MSDGDSQAKSLTELQDEAAALLDDALRHPRLGAVLSLVEELGELVKEVMEAEIYGQDSPELRARMGDEAADILFSLFEVCTAYGLNLEEVYAVKQAKIRAKIPQWREQYGPGLQRVRAKLD